MTARHSPYTSPAAFRCALTDKLKDLASTSPWNLHELQRQMAYDRLLERLYLINEGWVVKGATALLARQLGVRATIDVDFFRDVSSDDAERELRQAVDLDLGDWFRFEAGPAQAMSDGARGIRVPISAFVGATSWVRFRVDVVGTDIRMTGEPESMPPLARVMMPDVEQHGYRVYPLVDHVADKCAAILERHGASGQHPSTRFKDLVRLATRLATKARFGWCRGYFCTGSRWGCPHRVARRVAVDRA